jgi:Holliday junction DNA helicase RuvA
MSCAAATARCQRLPALGEETLLHIESQWSESAGLRLYGFSTREDRKAFVLLQAIQGVGPKAAMAVLDVLSPAELAAPWPARTRPRSAAPRAWGRSSPCASSPS